MNFKWRLAAIILLALFSLKMGNGLLLHNLVHSEAASQAFDHNNQAEELSFACNCIDDFLIPVEEATPLLQVYIDEPNRLKTVCRVRNLDQQLCSAEHLRGPPAFSF